jgi:hypothetical protein
MVALLVPKGDPSFFQIIGRHLKRDFVALGDADMELPHLPGKVGENPMAIRQLHTKHPIGKDFFDGSIDLNLVSFRHKTLNQSTKVI